MSLVPYPASLPQEALMMMLDKVRGREVPIPELIHGAWNLSGYALAQSMGGGQLVVADAEAISKMSDEELLSSVLRLYGSPVEGGATSITAVPWLAIARIAIKVLMMVL